MEACGANFFDEDWESLSKLFSIEENNSSFDFPDNVLADNCFHERSQESSNSDENQETSLFLLGQQNQFGHCLNLLHQDNDINTFEPSSMDLLHINNLNTPVFSDDHVGVMEEILVGLNPESWGNNNQLGSMQTTRADSYDQLKRKFAEDDDTITNLPLEGQSENNSSEGPRKKARVSRNNKNKRATQPIRKNKRAMQEKDISEEEIITNNNNGNKQSSSSCSNIDQEDSNNTIPNNNSQEISNSASLNSNGKARATRGSATDPQSLYARRRRERINERLKILQGLVPNGTKVDISTMLEEAVHYVKFLQLQIKLLSSDELWMYAPIAYNGIMDVGMYQKICPNLWP